MTTIKEIKEELEYAPRAVWTSTDSAGWCRYFIIEGFSEPKRKWDGTKSARKVLVRPVRVNETSQPDGTTKATVALSECTYELTPQKVNYVTAKNFFQFRKARIESAKKKDAFKMEQAKELESFKILEGQVRELLTANGVEIKNRWDVELIAPRGFGSYQLNIRIGIDAASALVEALEVK